MSINALPNKYAVPVLMWGTRLRTFPLPLEPDHYLVEGLYLQRKAEFERIPYGAEDIEGEYSDAICLDCQPQKEEGDGVWFKVWFGNRPRTYTDYTSMSVIYPGLAGSRAPQPARTVTAAVVRRFYEVGTAEYPTEDDIPVTEQTVVTFDGVEIGFVLSGNTITIDSFTVTTGGSAPGVTATPQQVGGFLFDGDMEIGGTGALTRYTSMMEADAEDKGSYSIVAEASKPGHYMGPFWFTDTVYVKAR